MPRWTSPHHLEHDAAVGGLRPLWPPELELAAIEGPAECSHRKQTPNLVPWGLDLLDSCSSGPLLLQSSTRAKLAWLP
jgi:hypothetical protein